MYGADIKVKHWINHLHHRDLLAYAERQRAAAIALEARVQMRRPGLAEARAAIAVALLRAGSWLMPEPVPVHCAKPG